MTKMFSDILNPLAGGNIVVLALLDLSAAFDTVDHSILLHCLLVSYSISGIALDWISSYLTGQQQCAVHSGSQSSFDNTAFRVRQGSVLGPLLLLYMVDLVLTIQKHGLYLHLFTDDMQVYGWCWPNEITFTSLLDVTRLCA